MRTLIERGLYFESPRFHDGELWFCDSLTSKVLRSKLDQTSELVCKLNGVPSGLGFLPRGDLIIVSMFRQKLYRCAKVTPEAYAGVVKKFAADYGPDHPATGVQAEVSGKLARVTYKVEGLPKFDQQAQPWAREGGAWKYDAC